MKRIPYSLTLKHVTKWIKDIKIKACNWENQLFQRQTQYWFIAINYTEMLLKGVVNLEACSQHLNLLPKSSAAGRPNCISSKHNFVSWLQGTGIPQILMTDRSSSAFNLQVSKNTTAVWNLAWKTTAVSTGVISSWKCSILHSSIQHYPQLGPM